MNFWGYLIEGLTQILVTVLAPFPTAAVNPVLATGVTILYFAIVPVLFFVGPFIKLEWFVTVVGAILAMEAIRAVIALVRLAYKLIPMMG